MSANIDGPVDVETAGLTKVVKNNQVKDETEAEQTAGRG